MFGATADGVTDDTEAVQAALDQGGVIYFPAGVYKVTKQLTTTKPCVIKMFKQYPSEYGKDYPLVDEDLDLGARIDCYPSEDEQYGLLVGDGCEIDGLFVRAMNGFSGVLLKYDNAHEYSQGIKYQSYPSAMRFSHIRLDCDKQNKTTTIPLSMFDFYPKNKYFYILDDIVIGQGGEFATYGFRSVIDPTTDRWANSVRINNLCLTGLFDYPLYIEEGCTEHTLTNWIFEGLSIQTYPYSNEGFEQTLEGHKAVITLKRMSYCLFSGCYIWDLYAAKYQKLFDCENLNNISCVGCSEEFYYGTKKLIGDSGEDGIETVLKDRLQEVADDANVKTLTMSTTVSEDGGSRINLADNHGNTVHTDIPPVVLSDEQLSSGIGGWMDNNALPVEQVGKNKLNIYSEDMKFGYAVDKNGKLLQATVGGPTASYLVTHFIPVKQGDIFRMSHNGQAFNWSEINEYDKDLNFLTKYTYSDEAVGTGFSVAIKHSDTAYIMVSCNTKGFMTEEEKTAGIITNLEVVERMKLCVILNNANISYEPYEAKLVGGLSQYFLLTSPNGTQYSVAVTDDGIVAGKDKDGNIAGSTIPVKTSQLENDSGFITAEDLPENGNADISDYFETTADNEEPIYGEELASADGWISDGWTGDFANGFTHTTGNTNSLIFTMPEDTAQNTYRIAFRCSESIAVESLMVKCGGSELFDLYGQPYDPITLGIASVENGNLEFVPASTFKDTITDISIKRVTGFNATKQTITDSTGEISCEMRTTKSSLDNVFIGKHSGEDNISGVGCVAVGASALKSNTSGFWNVGIGLNALRDNTVGSRNVGIGYIALAENITGTRNIAIGSFALNHNKTGNKNIAIGADCLDKNKSGSQNVAIGLQALYRNVSGNFNTAIGVGSLGNSTSDNNTAVGYHALDNCTTGNTNIALGYCAGAGITTGSSNFALGANTLYKMKTGSNNIAIGVQAGRGQGTTAGFKHGIFIGANAGYALCNNADYNILIGCNAGKAITTGTYNIVIGDNIETPTPTTSYWVNIGGLYEGSRNASDKYAKINGGLQLSDVPTSDPAIAGRVWNDNGILKVSAG